MIKKLLLSFFLFTFAFTTYISAQDYAAVVKVSTLGITAEGLRSFGPDLNARLGFSFFSYKLEGGGGTKDDYKYAASANLTSVSLLADYFPFQNWLRLTGGLVINLNKAELEMDPAKSYTVGGQTYTPATIGGMDAKIDFNKVSPYIGLGIGNPTAGESGLGFTFDVGAMYHGSPKVNLNATGLLAPSADQAALIESNLDWFKFYPVLSLGLSYKF
jgi:hypothetical protein